MKEKIKTFLSICLLVVALPYIITLIFQGNKENDKENTMITFIAQQFNPNKKEKELLKLDDKDMDMEHYLIGVVASEIPITYEPEMIRAQTVIARTNLLCAVENNEELPKSLNSKQMLKLWGQEGFTENYQVLVDAVESTKGEVLVYKNKNINAAFHSISAGMTRTAENENGNYLCSVDSHYDISADGFLKVIFLSKEKFVNTVKDNFGEAQIEVDTILDNINIESRDSADYVNQMSIGGVQITGEEFRNSFKLNSACFYIALVEEEIRIVSKGLGHGLGVSQYGGNELAKLGKNYKEILQYYYKDIKITQ